ncbi:MAG: hypothetical protein SPJ46_07830, partial [Sodaliphilus sp.]|nr:hypothetical protein [Sodaliphilus sp.]
KRDPNALCVLEYDNLYLLQMINIQCIILIIGGREISRPYQNVGYRLEKFEAVFYVFVFYSIHDSATKHNLSPQIFH